MTGVVEKTTVGTETLYRIGDILIVAQAPIPELEEKVGREIILRVEEGCSLRQSLKSIRARGGARQSNRSGGLSDG